MFQPTTPPIGLYHVGDNGLCCRDDKGSSSLYRRRRIVLHSFSVDVKHHVDLLTYCIADKMLHAAYMTTKAEKELRYMKPAKEC